MNAVVRCEKTQACDWSKKCVVKCVGTYDSPRSNLGPQAELAAHLFSMGHFFELAEMKQMEEGEFFFNFQG